MISELVERVFAARNAAHLAHWAETSGFRHTVLADFYEGVIDHLDGLVEAFTGLNSSGFIQFFSVLSKEML